MAGLRFTTTTTTLPCSKPLLPNPKPHCSLSLSSLHSVIFGLRLYHCPYYIPNRPSLVYFSVSVAPVSARYGGGVGRGGSSRKPKSDEDDEALNISAITSDNVRLIDERQNMVGIVSRTEALQMADNAELDLVILSPDADPPVVRIMDYSKYRYEQQKKKREQQKRNLANRMELKLLKMGYNIDVHDYSVRLKAAQKFLKDGDKVKVSVNLKGRENDFRNNAIELLRRFQNDIGELAIEEEKNFRERNIFIILVPNKGVVQKGQESPKKKEKSSVSEVSASV